MICGGAGGGTADALRVRWAGERTGPRVPDRPLQRRVERRHLVGHGRAVLAPHPRGQAVEQGARASG
jgi:hypothetical protein